MTFKVVDNKNSDFREAIVDKVCAQAFGTKYPTKEGVFRHHGPMVARMFAKGLPGACEQSSAATS